MMKDSKMRCDCCGRWVPDCSLCHLHGEFPGAIESTFAWDVAICERCFDLHPIEETTHWAHWLFEIHARKVSFSKWLTVDALTELEADRAKYTR